MMESCIKQNNAIEIYEVGFFFNIFFNSSLKILMRIISKQKQKIKDFFMI